MKYVRMENDKFIVDIDNKYKSLKNKSDMYINMFISTSKYADIVNKIYEKKDDIIKSNLKIYFVYFDDIKFDSLICIKSLDDLDVLTQYYIYKIEKSHYILDIMEVEEYAKQLKNKYILVI